MSLVQALVDGPLDIVGDVHGEHQALDNLLAHLGYDRHGQHPQGRHLVFVGDLCDRGPDTPAVLARVLAMLAGGRAQMVLGNHEINLLCQDAKDGSGWFFDSRVERDMPKYAPFARLAPEAAAHTQAALARLPVALERADLRIVHAAWSAPHIEAARSVPLGQVCKAYQHWKREAEQQAQELRIAARMQAERQHWPHDLEDSSQRPPFLAAHCDNELNKAVFNPLKVLTAGVERACTQPFYGGGKWRFVERVAWWQDYDEAPAVVIGHYWRSPLAHPVTERGQHMAGLFGTTAPLAWHGRRANVFCVDYSVGGRWAARLAGKDPQHGCRLAALRWPERTLVFDNGEQVMSSGFGLSRNGPSLLVA